MTERTANYERARLWFCNPNGRHHLLPVCPHLFPDARAPPARPDWEEGQMERHRYTCGRRESRLLARLPLPFPDVSELESALITREGGIEAQRGPWLGCCHSASLNLNPAGAVHPAFLAPALEVAELNNFPRPFFGSVR